MAAPTEQQWVVVMDGGRGVTYGPLPDIDACYATAAKVSKQANDWEPVRLTPPPEET
jgi:hypothetical protein